jgi:L-lactate dehydrogenase complex protein LldF
MKSVVETEVPSALSLRNRAARGAADATLAVPLATARRASTAIRRITAGDTRLRVLKKVGTEIRAASAAGLPNSVFELKNSLERRGFYVHFAADSDRALEIVLAVARAHSVRTVVKSKSMATEEIGLNRALEAAGIRVIETDLGEFIVQLAGERPAHILAPAINKTASAVARLFVDSGVANPDEIDVDRPDKETLTALARRYLRSAFLDADMGITGANFACAAEGVLVGISNEGNLRMCVSLPRVHVAVVPIEKIVRSLDDTATLLPLLTTTATAQPLTSYVSVIAGPRTDGETDGPEESHVILLDNGRSKIPATRYDSILRCVRCGACLNACPVYTTIGGHSYGTTYMGPIGAVLATLIEESGPSELPFASSLCGACTEICPVSIPLHELLYELRADPRHSHKSIGLRATLAAWARAWSTPTGFVASQKLVTGILGIAERIGVGSIRQDNGSSKRLVLADSSAARLARRILRRRVIPVPQAPDAKNKTGSSVRGPARPSLAASPKPWRTSQTLQSHAISDVGQPDAGTRENHSSPDFEYPLTKTLVTRLTRNGVRASIVETAGLSVTLSGLLESAESVCLDADLAQGQFGEQIASVLRERGIRPLRAGIDDVTTADIGIVSPLLGVAETGSLLLRFGPAAPRLSSLLPPALVAILPADRIVEDLHAAFARLRQTGILSGAVIISGPSKTADIEMTLENGVHGPGVVSTLIVE